MKIQITDLDPSTDKLAPYVVYEENGTVKRKIGTTSAPLGTRLIGAGLTIEHKGNGQIEVQVDTVPVPSP